jgi:lipopolysaccharide/colanic/teichoic acid biosynthesis glycosyltransferase
MKHFFKRVFDVISALIGLILLSPLLLVVAVMVRLKLGSPVFFRHQRPGLGGRPFELIKFRTMTDEQDPSGKLLPDSERLPSFGRFLRSTSMDELPELLCVLKGDMSLVGPRPLMMKYLPRYTAEQARRHEVKPGITGWSQVNGRNASSWERKLELDTWYADHWSLWLDLKILIKTPISVLKREGITQPGEATASEFMGAERNCRSGESQLQGEAGQ